LHLNLITLLLFMSALLSGPFAATSDSPRIEDRARETTLDNGMKIVVIERPTAPVFFSLISFRVGSSHEQTDRTGLSHFLEHMLFKGTKSVGTSNFKAEAPIMQKLEALARQMRELQVALKAWRYDPFNDHAVRVKADLPPEVRERVGTSEAAGWRAVLEVLPTVHAELPEEWRRAPWMLTEKGTDYWAKFRQILTIRAEVHELLAEQKRYITESEPLDGIYDMHGSATHNAFTACDQTTYMVGLPANCLELYMFLEGDRFQNPVFREFYSEREVVMEELRLRSNDPDSRIYLATITAAFSEHPYGRPVIGLMSDIRSTLLSDMEDHFYRYYAPNNCQMTIVGDVKAEEVFRLAKANFGKWKSSQVAQEITMLEPPQEGERRIEVEYDAEPQLMIAWHRPAAPHPDAYALGMLQQILSMGATSRFYRNIFVGKGLTAGSPGCWDGPDDRYPNLTMIAATPKAPHTLQAVEEAIYEEIEKLKMEMVSDRELERARNRLRKWELSRMKSNQWLAFSVSGQFVNRGDWRTMAEDYDRLMQVTSEDIQRVAKTYFTKTNRTVAYLVKPATETVEEGQ